MVAANNKSLHKFICSLRENASKIQVLCYADEEYILPLITSLLPKTDLVENERFAPWSSYQKTPQGHHSFFPLAAAGAGYFRKFSVRQGALGKFGLQGTGPVGGSRL